jgi:L-ascorbate metabolism protein UlaG (beta-lactamase superfamily)
MEITWYGHACFRLWSRDLALVTDPYDKTVGYTLPRVRADIVTVSHDHPHHSHVSGVKGESKVIAGPGEYEVRGVFITGIPTFHDRKSGKERGANTVYLIEFDDLTVCHLGDLGHVPTQEQVEDLSDINVLLVPVGGGPTLNAAQAAEVVGLLEPHVIIPMHYRIEGSAVKLDPVDKFLKEMGAKGVKPQESLKVSKSTLPEESQVVLLVPKQS